MSKNNTNNTCDIDEVTRFVSYTREAITTFIDKSYKRYFGISDIVRDYKTVQDLMRRNRLSRHKRSIRNIHSNKD